MIRITWKANLETISALRSKGPRVVAALMSKLNILMFGLSKSVQTQKLSGQMLTPRTGKLRASVHPVLATLSGTRISAAVEAAGSPLAYGNILHEGSRAHTVVATKARMLAFLVDGKQRFAKAVSHPGTTPKPFMSATEQESATMIHSELEQTLRQVVEE